MNDYSILEDVICSKCGSHKFKTEPLEKNMYVCCEPTNDEQNPTCNNIMYLCKKCNKVYPKSMFGLHGDVYECKECGSVQWTYTDNERKHAELMTKLTSMTSNLSAWKDKYGF